MIDLTPDQFRTLGYRAVDLIAEQLAALPSAQCRSAMPDAIRQSMLDQPLPAAGRDAEQVLDAVAEYVLPYPMGNNSPRFFGWVNSPAAPLDALNRRLLDLVLRQGQVFLTSTQLDGMFVLRACVVNFRTQESDLDVLLDVLAEAGQRVLAGV